MLNEKQIKRIEDKCVLKSKKDFINACNNADIPAEWYSFEYDKKKPVCVDNRSVYYGDCGVVNCSVYMSVWDIAFEKLMNYKQEYEWEHSDEKFRVVLVQPEYKWNIKYNKDNEYPFVTVYETTPTETPVKEMLEDGWIPDCYIPYDGLYYYSKTADIREIIEAVTIRFKKRTDDRDYKTFNYEKEFLYGSFRYPIPHEIREQVVKELFEFKQQSNGSKNHIIFSEDTVKRIMAVYSNRILEDEYNALYALKETHLNELSKVVDNSLPEKEQKKLIIQKSRDITSKCPAVDNYLGSRSNIIIHKNLDIVYKLAECSGKRPLTVEELREMFGK